MEQEEKKSPVVIEFATVHKLTRDVIANILTDGLWIGYCAWDDIDYDKADYESAKADLLAEGLSNDQICIEDVQAKMLENGKRLRLHEVDHSSKTGWHTLGLEDLVRGLCEYGKKPINGTLEDVLQGDPNAQLDANDYDAILQYAIFGEIVIG